jgi:methyl-accepting chemotaxis protein
VALTKDGTLTREQAQAQAVAVIESMRYDGSKGYFWINDMQPKVIIHPAKPELNGQDVSKVKDGDGGYIFVRLVDIVKRSGAGFADYNWPKPGEKKPVAKVAYVRGVPEWGWVLGTGLYVDDVQASVQSRTIKLTTYSLLVVLLTSMLSVLFGKSIMDALGAVRRVVDRLAAGDLTVRVGMVGKDEFAVLGRSLDQALDRTHEAITATLRSAETLAGGTEQLSATSNEIETSSTRTAASAAQLRASADRVASDVQGVVTGAEEMYGSISEISRSTSEAASIALSAVELAGTTNTAVTRLNTSSAEIIEVINLISSIAEQTNLLSLNATIEAARAGETGKGFAVVANEVKDLAQETAQATDNVSRIVKAIQTDTASTVAAINRIGEVISQINEHQCSIAGAVEEQSATTNDIARGVGEAAHQASAMAGVMAIMSGDVQQVNESLGTVRASTTELARLAHEMREVCGHFKL